MILTAHQPVYMPWLGLFHKISLAEMFCVFDIAQYQKKDFNNRNKIKTNNGELLISVPVESKDHFEKKICDIRIIENGWRKKHFKSISLAYKKAEYFDQYIKPLEDIILNGKQKFLTDLNFDILKFSLDSLNIDIPIVKASDYDFKGKKSDLVLDMCVMLDASKYIFGSLGEDYADIKSFEDNNVDVFFQNYMHPEYKQLHGEFKPYMFIFDLFFNEGENSKNILMSGNIERI